MSKTLRAGVGAALAVLLTFAPAATPARAAAPAPAPATAPVVAKVGDAAITLEQLQRPLIEAYGLNVLLNLVQLEVVKMHAAHARVAVTPADIEAERQLTIERMFKEANEKRVDKINDLLARNKSAEAEAMRQELRKDNETAFEQFLANQKLSRAEFDIVTETNAYLRKLAQPMLDGKITEANLQEAFDSLYGLTVKCRHIQFDNLQELQEGKRRLAAAEPFAKVAMEMSRNTSTGPLGGSLPPFSLATQGLPQNFKDAAFALKNEGDITDVVHAEGAYHLIQLEKRIPPKVMKFEDVKESLRADLHDRALQATIKQMRQQVADQSMQAMAITDPTLKKQWDERVKKQNEKIKDREEIRKQLEKEREQAATQPLTELQGLPTTPAQPAPAQPAASEVK